MYYVPLKHWYLPTKLHGTTTQKSEFSNDIKTIITGFSAVKYGAQGLVYLLSQYHQLLCKVETAGSEQFHCRQGKPYPHHLKKK
jgi:hypothetical protein